jgi:streptogramin lyase
MPDVFISYRRGDAAGHAGRVYDGLNSRFHRSRVFMDVDAIEPGVDFVERIQLAVASCDVLLVLIGETWIDMRAADGTRRLDEPEDFVRLEVAAALARDVRVVPVLVEGAAMPGPDDLPEDIRPLARRNAIELSDARWHYDMSRLIQAVERAGKERRDGAGASPARAVPRPSRKTALIAGAGVVAIVAAVAAVAGLAGGGDDDPGAPDPRQAGAARLFGNNPRNAAGAFTATTVQTGPGAVVDLAAGEGGMWAANLGAGTVARIDARTGKLAGEPIPVGDEPSQIAVGEGAVWAVDTADDQIVRIDPATRRAERPPELIGGFSDDVAAGAGAVWATTGDGLKRIDPQSGRVERTLDTGASARVVTGRFTQVAVTAEARLLLVDAETNRVSRPIRVGETAAELTFDDRGAVWVADPQGGSVDRVTPDRRVHEVRVGGAPGEVAFGAGAIWAFDLDGARLTRIDPRAAEVVGEPIALGHQPTSMGADDRSVWVGYSDGRVRRITP